MECGGGTRCVNPIAAVRICKSLHKIKAIQTPKLGQPQKACSKPTAEARATANQKSNSLSRDTPHRTGVLELSCKHTLHDAHILVELHECLRAELSKPRAILPAIDVLVKAGVQ